MNRSRKALIAGAVLLVAAGVTVQGSSHREGPGITGRPKLDGTDFYMFRSYEPGRQDYVTLIANYVPPQDAYGGPNFFTLDPPAVYEIHVDNDGDAREDLQPAPGPSRQRVRRQPGRSVRPREPESARAGRRRGERAR